MTIKETMACSAFAEAGEPCPICEKPGETKPADKPATSTQVSTDFACAAFAEAGEACPICSSKDDPVKSAALEKKESAQQSLEENFACAAFHEQNLECPIGTDKKK